MTKDRLRVFGLRIILLCTAILLLSGCPLVSDLPLSDPAAAVIDAALTGSWEARDGDSGEAKLYRFLPFDEHELLGLAVGDGADSVDSFRFFSTRIDGVGFLNVRELGKGASGWYILRYEIRGDSLVMALVDDNLFEGRSFSSAGELSDFVRANLSNPLLFASKTGEETREMAWIRKGGKP